jgi:hypothetical protein
MRIKQVNLLCCFCLWSCCVIAQSVDQVKADPLTYIWGEGTGNTIHKADNEALNVLVSQISTHVEGSFSLLQKELTEAGKDNDFKEVFKSVVNTYSTATLKNTERIVLGNEPNAKVFRYMKRSEIKKVFEERKEKILGFVENAEKAIAKNQVADALRYYYWALCLLKSHPYGGEIYYQKNLLATWLPMKINNVFSELEIQVSAIHKSENESLYTLDIRFKKQPVANFDYSYWDGSDYSNIVSAKNGMGALELYGLATQAKQLKIKAEYIFEGEARIDKELEDVLSRLDPIPFRKAYFTIPLNNAITSVSRNNSMPFTKLTNSSSYQLSMNKVLEAIKTKDYSSVSNEFTEEAYDVFIRLLAYGQAKLIGEPKLMFLKDGDRVICRSVPMCFNFKTNSKQFIEDVVFQFNTNKNIDVLSFGLSDNALKSIVTKEVWDKKERMILVNFLESYKTAYALKRLDYISSIFSDNALIITGRCLESMNDNYFKANRIVKYNEQSKNQYLKNLKSSFASKEYVNIKFEESEIRKAGKGGSIFGIQIKQNFFSSNYGDVGYLFLLVDLNNLKEPVIHVRTWQAYIVRNDSLYNLSTFF